MIRMLKIILLLILIEQGRSDHPDMRQDAHDDAWTIGEHPNRSCRTEDGWHRCLWYGYYETCVIRTMASKYCENKPRLNCTDKEMEFYDKQHRKYGCRPRYQVGQENVYLRCHPEEFQCQVSRICIPRYLVQDGNVDCNKDGISDDSDEASFLPNCLGDTEFRCSNQSNSRCIPRNWMMNGVDDCPHGTDEHTTVICHNGTEFQCPINKRCISRRFVNDNFSDCPGGSDEMVKNFTCIDRLEFSCEKVHETRRCVPREWVGNGIEECVNGDDEETVLKDCVDTEVKCLDNQRCVPKHFLCDGIQHCRDGSDEVELCSLPTMYRYTPQRLIPWSFILFESSNTTQTLYPDFQPQQDLVFGYKCHTSKIISGTYRLSSKLRAVPRFYISENISVCANNEDRCFDNQNMFTCARCLDGTIISKRQLCNDDIDCRDMSDECLCGNSKVRDLCENVFSPQNNAEETISKLHLVCNGRLDMQNRTDEEYCSKHVLEFNDVFSETSRTNEVFNCSAGRLNNYSMSTNQTAALYCDGNVDCPLMEDECSSECLLRNMKYREDLTRCFPFIFSQYYYSVSIRDNEYEVIHTSPITNEVQNQAKPRIVCDYSVIYTNPGVMRFTLGSSPTEHELCNYETKMYDNVDFLCDVKGVHCPWIHTCWSDENMKITISKVCDFKYDCADKSDEQNCPNHFYCRNGYPLSIPQAKVGDGRSDCTDRSDEIAETAFSSGIEMLKSVFLRYFIWFCAFSMLICNGVVLRKHFRKIGKIPSKTTVPYCNVYLLICLAISDSIFGLVLLAIGIKSQQFSGKYYEFDLEWRSSLTCNMIGILTVISSQTSVNLLVLMTGLRFYITYFPYMTKRINFNLLVVLSFISLGISTFLASFPIWGNADFVNSFYINPTLFLDVDVVTRSRVESYMRKTEEIALVSNFSGSFTDGGHDILSSKRLSGWLFNSENGRHIFPNRQIDIKGKLSFYSSSSVCFPDYFSKTSPASGYSLFIVLYNLSCLILICIGYLFIFHRARQSATSVQTADEERANKNIRKMMIRISFIVVTDILCWLPIIIMGILSYQGYEMPEIMHPLSAIVFLPINSLINPMIYSRLDKTIKRNLKKLLCPIWIRYCGNEGETRTGGQIPMQSLNNRVEPSSNISNLHQSSIQS